MRTRKLLYPVPVLVVLASTTALAQGPSPVGVEFQVNSYTTNDQIRSAAAMTAEGDFAVVWDSYFQDGSFWGVFGQRFDGEGNPEGDQFQVNTYTTMRQMRPAVAADAQGFVVVWATYEPDGAVFGVFGQRYDANGSPAGGEFQVNTYTAEYQLFPAVASRPTGGFVVVWESNEQDGDGYGISGRRYDAEGKPEGDEFAVNSYTTSDQTQPVVATNASDGFVVVWRTPAPPHYNIVGQRFDSAGSPIGGEFQVNTEPASSGNPSVGMGAAGNFVVVWTGRDPDLGFGVFGQRFDADGKALGEEFQVHTYTTYNQDRAAVATDILGNFVVVWDSFQDGSADGIFGQAFAADGSRLGGEFLVNSETANIQYRPAIAGEPRGDFVVVWESYTHDGSGWGIFGQRFEGPPIFLDGFETGDTSAWDAVVGN